MVLRTVASTGRLSHDHKQYSSKKEKVLKSQIIWNTWSIRSWNIQLRIHRTEETVLEILLLVVEGSGNTVGSPVGPLIQLKKSSTDILHKSIWCFINRLVFWGHWVCMEACTWPEKPNVERVPPWPFWKLECKWGNVHFKGDRKIILMTTTSLSDEKRKRFGSFGSKRGRRTLTVLTKIHYNSFWGLWSLSNFLKWHIIRCQIEYRHSFRYV